MLHDHKDIDGLIRAAKLHPTENIRDKLIELEVDTNGNWVGRAMADFIWRKAIPDTQIAA